MGKVKEKMQEMEDFENFVADTSPQGNGDNFVCRLDNSVMLSVDVNNSRTSVIVECRDLALGNGNILFLSEEEAVRLANVILERAAEL